MHPDIKKFWESGPPEWRKVYITEFEGTYVWYVIPGNQQYSTIAVKEGDSPITYMLKTQEYTEEQMLRIIKLKAFL